MAGLAAWTLSLDLVSSSSRHRGSLMIHRLYSERHLYLDINLLTSELSTAVADALERAIQHAVEVSPYGVQETPAFFTAQAG